MEAQIKSDPTMIYKITPLLDSFFSMFENSTFTLKMFYSFTISTVLWFPATVINSIAKLLLPNFDFFVIITIVLSIDLLFGIIKWWMKRQFDAEDMAWGFFRKVAVCYAGMVLFGSMGNLPAVKEHPDIQSYINLLGQLVVFCYIGISALISISFVSGGLFGKGIIKRFKKFNDTGDVGQIIKDKTEINVIQTTTTDEAADQ